MKCLKRSVQGGDHADRYASEEDFRRVFSEDVDGLYQLSLLLTGDPEKAEQSFVAGLEDCARTNNVFRDWARAWVKLAIIKNTIHALRPVPADAKEFLFASADPQIGEPPNGQMRNFELHRVLALKDFERFVFVMTVLEGHSVHDCALLLSCSFNEVRKARSHALQRIAHPVTTPRESNFANVQETTR